MLVTIPLLGVRLRVSFWFFAAAALALLLDAHLLLWYLALPVFLHELGHIAVMAFCRVKVAEIYFTPVSIRIITQGQATSYRKELAISLGGIAANLVAALLWRLFAFQSMRAMLMVASNLAVAAFNMLPVGNLDGGRALSILCARYLRPDTARIISALAGFAALVPLTAGAAFLLLSGSGNFTLALACVYLAFIVAKKQL